MNVLTNRKYQALKPNKRQPSYIFLASINPGDSFNSQYFSKVPSQTQDGRFSLSAFGDELNFF